MSADAIFQRAGRSSRRDAAWCRAATSADRFPAVPPDTKHPPASGGSPTRSAIHRQRLVLRPDGAGALHPAAAVRRRGAQHQVEQDARPGRSARDEREVRRVVRGDRRRSQDVGPDPQRLLASDALGGDRLARARRQLLGRRRTIERREVRDPRAGVVLERAGEVLGLLRVPVHLLHRRTFHGCRRATGRPEGPARTLPRRSCVSRRAPRRSRRTRRCTSGRRPRCAAPRWSTAPRRPGS